MKVFCFSRIYSNFTIKTNISSSIQLWKNSAQLRSNQKLVSFCKFYSSQGNGTPLIMSGKNIAEEMQNKIHSQVRIIPEITITLKGP